jgi:DNA-binding transcriptional LysR family regulator
MNIRFLETFIWLTRLRSFRATAEKLNTTQPNISARIAALEDQLRVDLYVRGGKEFQPTAAGRRLLEYAEQIVDISGRMQQELRGADASDNAVLRVGIIELVTMSWLPQFVQAIRASDVMTEVDFIHETTSSLLQSLRKDELDLAFVWGPANEPNIVSEHICSYAMCWLGSPALCKGMETMDVVDVARLPVIASKKEASDHSIVKEYFAAYGLDNISRVEDRVRLSSYSMGTSLQLIRTGLGVMDMAPLLLADELRDGSVVILPVAQALPPTYLTACYKPLSARPGVMRLVQAAHTVAKEYASKVDPAHMWI